MGGKGGSGDVQRADAQLKQPPARRVAVIENILGERNDYPGARGHGFDVFGGSAHR